MTQVVVSTLREEHDRVDIRDFFFFNDTATTEIYTLSLHDALPIFRPTSLEAPIGDDETNRVADVVKDESADTPRSEEHTSELQSQSNLVCRLLLEKKNRQVSPPCSIRTRSTRL